MIFNSNYNRTTFFQRVLPFLNVESDMKFKQIKEKIEPKCEVLYFPIKFDQMRRDRAENSNNALHFVWPHRWEHDKNPQQLTETLLELDKRQVAFKVSIIGQTFGTRPSCFDGIQDKLRDKLIHFGCLNRDDYLQCLLDADIVISTAGHEFYGVSM